MASNRADHVSSSLVTPLLECAICLEPFSDPLVLPCVHSFCSDCLDSHATATKTDDGTFQCPTCRQTCPIPEAGVRQLPKNFLANNLRDIVPSAALRELESMGEVIQCKFSTQQSRQSLHGEATVFCTQCDAYLCNTCVDAHTNFDLLKSHNLMSVSKKEKANVHKVPHCHRHSGHEINWYCKTCKLPACSDCILDSHSTHGREKLSEIAEGFRKDLQKVSKAARKRLAALEVIARDLDSNKSKMQEDLDRVDTEVTDLKENIFRLVEDRTQKLKEKIKKEREKGKKAIIEAQNSVKILQENALKTSSCAQTLCTAQAQFTFRTAVQAPSIKEQLLHQEQLAVPSVEWRMERQHRELGDLSSPSFMGSADLKDPVLVKMDPGKGNMGKPLVTFQLQFTGLQAPNCVASLHSNLICVSHYRTDSIWVYTEIGELRKKIKISGVEEIYGMVLIDKKQSQLAVVDGSQSKVHLVTLSADLEVKHITKEAPFVPQSISITKKGELALSRYHDKRCAVVNCDGAVLDDIQFSLPVNDVNLVSVTKSSCGFLLCDRQSGTVFFTDASGDVSASSRCNDPWGSAHTSFDYALVPDGDGGNVAVFTEEGDFLGSVQGDDGALEYPCLVHIDEAKKLLYVACGPAGSMEIRIYRYSPAETLPFPFSRFIQKMEMSLQVAIF